MKTAEQWHHTEKFVRECLAKRIAGPECNCIACDHVRAIQLDAIKEGMKRAADIVMKQRYHCATLIAERDLVSAQKTIYSVANNLTEKDS